MTHEAESRMMLRALTEHIDGDYDCGHVMGTSRVCHIVLGN